MSDWMNPTFATWPPAFEIGLPQPAPVGGPPLDPLGEPTPAWLDALVYQGAASSNLADVKRGLAALKHLRAMAEEAGVGLNLLIDPCQYLEHVRANLLSSKLLNPAGLGGGIVEYYAANPTEQQALAWLQWAYAEAGCGTLPLSEEQGFAGQDPPFPTPSNPFPGVGTHHVDVRAADLRLRWRSGAPGPLPVAGVEIVRDFRVLTSRGRGGPVWR